MLLHLIEMIFGKSRVPRATQAELESEGIVLLDPSINVVLNYRKYKSPRAYFGRRRHGWFGFVALTKRRLVGYGYGGEHVSIPLDAISPDNLEFENRNDECLWLSFDASDFADDRKGRMECRYYTSQARRFVDALEGAVRS